MTQRVERTFQPEFSASLDNERNLVSRPDENREFQSTGRARLLPSRDCQTTSSPAAAQPELRRTAVNMFALPVATFARRWAIARQRVLLHGFSA